MRLARKKPPAPKILSRIQDTSRVSRGFRQPANHRASAVARAANLEVYDGVEAANQAGLPMPGQF
jgi:hypothetical protein